MTVTNHSPAEDKVALFGALFRGREDVYPRRFESAMSGRSGYQPACANEWLRGVCDKPKTRCALCGQRKFLPVTPETLRRHLSGEDDKGRPFVMGVYPLLEDEHCWFVAADFDKEGWREDVGAVLRTCGDFGLPVAVERSRSGNGAHAWWFFSEPLPARLAREFASWLLTETLERRPEVGLDSYDRLFPNQDTMPKGGFGNLIALPLQKRARALGNSVFVEENFEPCVDQWAFLSSLRRLGRAEVEKRVDAARRDRRLVAADAVADEDEEHADQPWSAPPSRQAPERPLAHPLPEHVTVVLGDQLYLRKAELTPALTGRLRRLAAFQNPEFYKAQAMRLNTFGKPRVICCAEEPADFLALPRGCLDTLLAVLGKNGIHPVLQDERVRGTPLDVSFHGELRPEQARAGKALLAHDTGVLAAGTAFGKTVLAAWLIASRGVNTLVLVNRQQLQVQWVARLSLFLGIPEKEIGRLGGGHRTMTGRLDVALLQSLGRKGKVDDCVAAYGHVVADECHALSAPTFERVVRRAKARYITGLSATPVRKDGHQPIITMQCGPVRHRVTARQLSQTEPFAHVVQVRPTAFHASLCAEEEGSVRLFQTVCELVADESRNRLIVADVLRAVSEGRSPVVLTERREHLQRLADALQGKVAHVLVLRGGLGRKQVAALHARLLAIPDSEPRVLLATGRYLGEGFDDARLDTLLLVMPISWRGRIAQYAGRLHRRHSGKHEVRILDYADLNVPMLARMFDRRCRGYEAIGYRLVMPLSATPGWPAEVAVPVEPAWQETYAASVRRLCRDGVDASLGDLFVAAAWKSVSPETVGAEHARSATEAFLYRRLETLDATRGRFHLNAVLPIPFAGDGTMEVDLVCQELRLAVELDGAQHFADTAAYRRDRRKDALLQENGYLVLRFLAEDVCERLNDVLDGILRALSHRQTRQEQPYSAPCTPRQVPTRAAACSHS